MKFYIEKEIFIGYISWENENLPGSAIFLFGRREHHVTRGMWTWYQDSNAKGNGTLLIEYRHNSSIIWVRNEDEPSPPISQMMIDDPTNILRDTARIQEYLKHPSLVVPKINPGSLNSNALVYNLAEKRWIIETMEINVSNIGPTCEDHNLP